MGNNESNKAEDPLPAADPSSCSFSSNQNKHEEEPGSNIMNLDLFLQKPADVSYDDDEELVSLDATLAAITPVSATRQQQQQSAKAAAAAPVTPSTEKKKNAVVPEKEEAPAAPAEARSADESDAPSGGGTTATTPEHSRNPEEPSPSSSPQPATAALAAAVVVSPAAGEASDGCNNDATASSKKKSVTTAAASFSLPPADLFEDDSSMVVSPNVSFDKDELVATSTGTSTRGSTEQLESPWVRDAAATNRRGAVERLSTEEHSCGLPNSSSLPEVHNHHHPGGAAAAEAATTTSIEDTNDNSNNDTAMGDAESRCCPRSIPADTVAAAADKKDNGGDGDDHRGDTKEEHSSSTTTPESDAGITPTAESAELRELAVEETEQTEEESKEKDNGESESADPVQNPLSEEKSNDEVKADEPSKDKAAIDSCKQKEELSEVALTSGILDAQATDQAAPSTPDEGSDSIKPQETSKVDTGAPEPEKPENEAAAGVSEKVTTNANGAAQTVSMDAGDSGPSKTNSSEETKQAVGGMSKESSTAPMSDELRPAGVERESSVETKQATGAKEAETQTAAEPKDTDPLPPLPGAETPKSPLNANGKPLMKPSEVADDESTLASTVTGFGGPVSYVEFSNSNTNKDRPAASGTVVREVKVKPVFEPDDARLASLPKLLVADLWIDDEPKVKAALEHMGKLCAKPETITELLSHGGHMSLTLVLRKWSNSAEVQAAGLDTLYKAAESLDFCNAVVQLGALELAVIAMKNHPNSEEVLTAGCAALLNLTLPADVARQLVCELGGIQIVAQACATFPQNVNLQKYVLWLIQYMSYWENLKEPIVKGGGLQILTKIVETFSTSTEKNADTILKSARSTIQRLL